MADAPWVTIIGLGEDGPDGLPRASRIALEQAEIVLGPQRHLDLVGKVTGRKVVWPVPFADGIPLLETFRGQQVAVLASGDPFWFGAGSAIARALPPGDWCALPGVSTFSLAAARLGWALQETTCLGLHAAPLSRLRPVLSEGRKAIVLLRDGAAVTNLAAWLADHGHGASTLHVMEALGGPRERYRTCPAADFTAEDVSHPVCVGIEVCGAGLTLATGRPDEIFETDGQITKQPVRALTLSALAPRPGEHLWDIGGGSGSVAIEWLLADPSMAATAIETRADRADRIRRNASTLGVDRLAVVTGAAPDALHGLAKPDAVFIGGGMSDALLSWLFDTLDPGTRLVANAVTLESEALLCGWQADRGGDLLRIDLSRPAPLGRLRGWQAAYPVTQWSVVT